MCSASPLLLSRTLAFALLLPFFSSFSRLFSLSLPERVERLLSGGEPKAAAAAADGVNDVLPAVAAALAAALEGVAKLVSVLSVDDDRCLRVRELLLAGALLGAVLLVVQVLLVALSALIGAEGGDAATVQGGAATARLLILLL